MHLFASDKILQLKLGILSNVRIYLWDRKSYQIIYIWSYKLKNSLVRHERSKFWIVSLRILVLMLDQFNIFAMILNTFLKSFNFVYLLSSIFKFCLSSFLLFINFNWYYLMFTLFEKISPICFIFLIENQFKWSFPLIYIYIEYKLYI